MKVFEDTTGRDLSQFKLWYSQSGTPRLSVSEDYADGTYTLTFKQHTPPTPGQDVKDPKVIPIAVGLLNPNGDEVVETQVLEMDQAEQSFAFEGLASKPTPSILRGFSAPVVLDREVSREEQAFLLAHDTDPFNRWEANRTLNRNSMIDMIKNGSDPDEAWLAGLEKVIRDDSLDPDYRQLMLSGPSQSELAQVLFDQGVIPDPDAIWDAAERLRQHMAQKWHGWLGDLAARMTVDAPYRPDADQTGKRALSGALLSLISRLDGGAAAQAQFETADNMTLQLSALTHLIRAGKGDAAVEAFYDQWQHDRLVMDKWFGLQVGASDPSETVDVARRLTEHASFDWTNPNRFRAVMGVLAGHHAGFHRKDGSGYAFLADWLIKLDDKNPQTTARMCSAFQTWRRYDSERKALIRAQLERIMGKDNLSRDTSEMVSRILG